MQLSAVVLTKNEERNIERCLQSLGFCDEILLIDDFSEDKTRIRAKKYGAIIYKRKLNSNFSDQRNFALTKTKGKWVLFIDADEYVPRELANEITQAVNDPMLSFSGFYVRRTDTIWGRKLLHGETANVKLLRLARNGSGLWQRRIHEIWKIRGETYMLKSSLIHYPHQTLSECISDIDKMSTQHALANKEEKKSSSLIKIIIWPAGKFIYNYFLRLGFKDGTQGFMIAALMSFHSFLAWSKLWLLTHKN